MADLTRKRLIVIEGPTAVGKTEIAIQLAKRLITEIISADSRQIYKEMTIGTAKPTDAELRGVLHHFIDNISIEQPFDAGQYSRAARSLIDQLFEKYDTLILCGGSGLYIKAVLEGFDDIPDTPPALREEIIIEYKKRGLGWLQEQVAEMDPDYFEEVDQKNPQRLMRALELIRSTGKTATSFRKKVKRDLPFEVVKIGLELERSVLYNRINRRVDTMMESGLLEEAKDLYAKRDLNALQTVGYQELFGYFAGEYDFEEAVRLLKRNTRRYAKRQLTWFKNDNEVKWFNPDNVKDIMEYLDGK